MKTRFVVLLIICCVVFLCCGKKCEDGLIKNYEQTDVVKKQIAKLAPVEIKFDDSGLSDNEKKALSLIVKAAKHMDKIFLRQVYSQNVELKKALREGGNADYKVLKKYFNINFGPFDRLINHKAFINMEMKKPAGANYYPEDMKKEEFEKWIKDHPEDEEAFVSNFTVIRREGDNLVAIPYSEAYKGFLEPAGKLMKEAAELVENASLKKYLISRADAFLSNDYYQSDIDWMDLKDHKIEMVIGPYEVYEDQMLGYKAAFEAFITLVDKEESDKLSALADYLVDMERHLPIDDIYKNFNRGSSSPVVVVNEVFTAGDTKAGVQTTAFNLPNDERVRQAKGSKKVMLKNISRAKFDNCWIPIVKEVLSQDDLALVSFDSYFNHVLMHEFSHALGPGIITKDGKKTSVNKELKELYSKIEEAKADILGLWNLKFMIDKGVFPKELMKNIYVTYLGGIFRSVRFGIDTAHGGGNAIQLNYIVEKGGFEVDPETGRFSVNKEKIEEAVKQFSHDILMIQAAGDYDKAKALIDKYCVISAPLAKAIDAVKHVPIDILPIYAIEKK